MSAVKKDKSKKSSNPAAEAAWDSYVAAKLEEYNLRLIEVEKKVK
jgi:hypothetical protein